MILRCASAVFVAVLVSAGVADASAQRGRSELPPSPYVILGSGLLDPPRLEAIPVCVPARLSLQLGDFEAAIDGSDFEAAKKWLKDYEGTIAIQDPEEHKRDVALLRATHAARSASGRAKRLVAYGLLQEITRREREPQRLVCALIESARLLTALARLPEAGATTKRILKHHSWLGDDHASVQAAKFFDAELLYRRGDDFNAHLRYRELAGSTNPRLAAAARLRLTDLSFDAGKSRSVQLEYETLLPHGAAFGARLVDWALRAAEAALDAGEFAAAESWLDRYLEEIEDRDTRDTVEIRRADLDALRGKPEQSFKRLRGLWGRKGRSDVEALARVRSIDLGVSSEAPDVRIGRLHDATASHNQRVRVYALSVLVHELVLLGRIDEGVAAVTRLAYEGADSVLARRFPEDLAALLERARVDVEDEGGCKRMIRRLGGRYGILLDHARDVEPFLALGRCFESLRLHDLAVALYRSLARSFGSSVASRVALPLARTSLEVGDVALARAAAEANIRHGGRQLAQWRALLTRAEAALDHDDKARVMVRELLANNVAPDQRVSLTLLFAQLLDGRSYDQDTALLARTLEGTSRVLRDRDPTVFAEANMRTAEILRRQGRLQAATKFYELAADFLPEGARRDEAFYWSKRESHTAAGTREEESGVGGPWTRLARYDQAAQSLEQRHELGDQR